MHFLLLFGLLVGGQDSTPAPKDPAPKIRDEQASKAVDALRELDERAAKARSDREALIAVVDELGGALEAVRQPLPRRPLKLEEMGFDDLKRVGPEIEASRDFLAAWRARDASRLRIAQLLESGGALAETVLDDHDQLMSRTVALRSQLIELEQRVSHGVVLEEDLGIAPGGVSAVVEESAGWLATREADASRLRELVRDFERSREAAQGLPAADPQEERQIARIELALSTISEALAAQSELIARLTEAPAETLPAELERAWQEWEARQASVASATQKFEVARDAFAALQAERESNEVPRAGEVVDGAELYEVRRARRDIAYSSSLVDYFERDRELATSLREARDALLLAENDVTKRHAAFSRQTARVMAAIRLVVERAQEPATDPIELPEQVDPHVVWNSWRDLQSAEADRRELVAAAQAADLEGVTEERLAAERETLRLAEIRLQSELSHAEFVAGMEERSSEDLAALLAEDAGIELELQRIDAEIAVVEDHLHASTGACVDIAEELREIDLPYERSIVQRLPERTRELKEGVEALLEGEVLKDELDSLRSEPDDSIGAKSRKMISELQQGDPLETARWEQERVTTQQEHMRLLRSYCNRLSTARQRLLAAAEERRALGAQREDLVEQRVRQLKMRYAAANELSSRIAQGSAEVGIASDRLAEWSSSEEVAGAGESLRDWREDNAQFLARATYLDQRLEAILVMAPVITDLTESADRRANMIGTPVSRMTSALTPVDALETVSAKKLQFEAHEREAEETSFVVTFMKRFTSSRVVERFEDPLRAYYLELANADRVLVELAEAEKAYEQIAETWHEDRQRLLPARELAGSVQRQREFDYHAARYAASIARFPGTRERIEQAFRTAFERDLPYRLEVDILDVDECVDALFGSETRYTAQHALGRDLERLLSKAGIELEVGWYRDQVSRVRAMLERARNDQADLRRRIDDLRAQYRTRLEHDAMIGVVITLCIPVIAWLLVGLVRRYAKRFEYDVVGELGEHSSDRKRRLRTLARTVAAALSVLVWVLALIYIFAQLGLDVTPLIASASVVGLAVAFGAQALIKDFFYGFFILLENQFTVGDVVRLGTISGTVEKISLRITILRDLKGVVHYIPNGSIGQVSNMTQGWARVVLEISVPYREDPDRASAVLRDVLLEFYEDEEWNQRILEEPVVAGVENLTERSIDIRLMIKVRPGRQWEVAREARRRIKQRLDREGIESPFPHRVIHHLNETPDADFEGQGDSEAR